MKLAEWVRCDLDEVTAILAGVRDESADALVAAVLAARRIFVLGVGRSGLLARMFAMRLMQLGLQAYVVGDVTTPPIAASDLLVVLSGSGRTATAVTLAGQAKAYGAQLLAVTAEPTSPLASLADLAVVVPAGSVKTDANALEQAMAVVLDCVGAMLAEQLAQDNVALLQRHANLE
ncbi:MAG: SIS domain-containing protein [Caldilinea sp.]|nr:SIS domain-containing protein [Caldilinea sp.]